jgi:hypothetical protein
MDPPPLKRSIIACRLKIRLPVSTIFTGIHASVTRMELWWSLWLSVLYVIMIGHISVFIIVVGSCAKGKHFPKLL